MWWSQQQNHYFNLVLSNKVSVQTADATYTQQLMGPYESTWNPYVNVSTYGITTNKVMRNDSDLKSITRIVIWMLQKTSFNNVNIKFLRCCAYNKLLLINKHANP